MTPCPSCHQPVEILERHLGTLFSCPHCNAVYFINFDGRPELANHEADLSEAEAPEAAPAAPSSYESPAGDFSQSDNVNAETNYSIEAAPVSEAPLTEEGFSSQQGYEQQSSEYEQAQSYEQSDGYEQPSAYEQQPAYQEPSGDYGNPESQGVGVDGGYSIEQDSAYNDPEPPPPMEEVPFDFNKTLDQAPAEAPPPVSVSDNADFSDVTNFANTDSGAGPLTYVVVIDGIESSQLLYQLKEAMTDSRFGWDVSELMNQVGGGRLVIAGLNPAKASVLISRIKYLPFKISWRQDVLSGS